jgi:hypothetical protein
MSHLFNDKMYFSYEVPPIEDKTKYEYQKLETGLFKLLRAGSREELERLAQEKLIDLKLQDRGWTPYAVIRDTPIGFNGEPETMKPVQIWFRLEKAR